MERKTKNNLKAQSAAAATPARQRIIEESVQHENIVINLIDPSPFQPRADFPKDEIEEIAATMRVQGQLVPGCVRRKAGGRFELVAGERRLRAAKIACLEFFRAEIRELTDAQVRYTIMIEGRQRKDFNPIEEARALKIMLDSGDARSQQELADRLKIEQGTLSNRLRLLELPEAWKKKVISREITERHARAVLPYIDYPRIMDALLTGLDSEIKNSGLPTCDQWEREELPSLIYNDKITRTLNGTDYDFKTFRHFPKFTPTEEQRTELRIITVQRGRGKEEFATNIKLWDKLQADFKKEYLKKQDAKGKNGKSKTDKPLTPAEIKKRERERTEQYGRRLAELVTNVKRWAVAGEILDGNRVDQVDLIRLLLCGIGDWPLSNFQFSFVKDSIEDLAAGDKPAGKKQRLRNCHADSIWSSISLMDEGKVKDLAAKFLFQCFFDAEDGPCALVDPDQVAEIFDNLGLSIQRIWEEKYLGPFTEGYFNLHGKEALFALMQEIKLSPDPGDKKSDMVAACVRATEMPGAIPFPKELRENTPKKKSKRK